jgi:maltose alpha-D-glucosyltransferase/alpha-amylase
MCAFSKAAHGMEDATMEETSKLSQAMYLRDDQLWYKDALIYELHVRSFADSSGDGIGDFRGLARKLDYLQDLGVTALWLLPFYPSPLRDDGYDIADYVSINDIYGSLADFKIFLRAAHRRGLRVVTELVLNHTSDRHPWFQLARRSPPGSPERDYYVWSDTPDRYREARVIFKDFEPANWSWDPVAKAYFWHRFFHHQPDLNFDNPEVRKALFQTVDFWLGLGIDGLRLDAVPYLYEREGTNCENLPETHAFLKQLRQHVDQHFPNRMLLAEANQWPEDAAAYFGAGDECHMAFQFPVMPRLFMGIRMEDRFPIVDILQQTPPTSETSQWALFLRNHDELTLEMVTDEDRDYMYRMYAQDPQARINLGIRRRLAPLLENHRGKIELMNGLLFSLPGTPVLYYGDEIGMGDNIYLGDRNGVRTPMQWSGERNAGFSQANPQQLYLPVIIDPQYHFEMVNVETQQNNSHSLLWWMKRLIALRKRYRAFGRGSLELLSPRNHKVLAFIRSYQEECVLVVANLSRFAQYVELDLGQRKGMVPVEMLGRTAFPPIGEQPYVLTLGSYAFYWFMLESRTPAPPGGPKVVLHRPTLEVAPEWDAVLNGKSREALEEVLPGYLKTCYWFTGKDRQTEAAMILETVPIPYGDSVAHLALVQVEYSEGDSETYALPLTFARGPKMEHVQAHTPHAVVAHLHLHGGELDGNGKHEGILFDAMGESDFCQALLDAIGRRRRFRRADGEVVAVPLPSFRKLKGTQNIVAEPLPNKGEQSNSSVIFRDRFFLKFFRRVEGGVNPELEIEQFLSERTGFRHVPGVAGAVHYRRSWGQPMTLAVLQEYVPNEGNAWRLTLDSLGTYFERVLTAAVKLQDLPSAPRRLLQGGHESMPPPVQELIGPYMETVRLLGRRSAELHVALASAADDPNFSPELFTPHDLRSLYQTLRSRTLRAFDLLKKRLPELAEPLRADGQRVLKLEETLLKRLRAALGRNIRVARIRCHGDYRLGQILFTGKDFVIVDFDGDVTRPLSDRRRKKLALGDVAGMLRSFHYASILALKKGSIRSDDIPVLEPWAVFWQKWVAAAFWKSYLDVAAGQPFLPANEGDLAMLLEFSLLRRILQELPYELNKQPERVHIPLQGILQLFELEGA